MSVKFEKFSCFFFYWKTLNNITYNDAIALYIITKSMQTDWSISCGASKLVEKSHVFSIIM